MNLPEPLTQAVRAIARQEALKVATPRVEFEELVAQVQALRRRLNAQDAATLRALLPALHHLLEDRYVPAAEVMRLACGEMVPADDALRAAVARFAGVHASKALGKFLSKVAGERVGPYFLQVLPGARPKDAALYRVRRVSTG